MRTKTMIVLRAAMRWVEAFLEVRLPMNMPGLRTRRR
jgi:hypothetical protein